MRTETISLDLSQLEKMKRNPGGKITARCPACAEEGSDTTGNHLVVYPDGHFGCAVYPKEPGTEHRRRIFELIGIRDDSEINPEAQRRWKEKREREREQRRNEIRLQKLTGEYRETIIARHPWPLADVWEDSPLRPEAWMDYPRAFLGCLFAPEAIVWTGATWHSGDRFGPGHWRTVAEWMEARPDEIGPMVSPATWTPGIINRAADNIVDAPYIVLDFDEDGNGRKPRTPEEIEKHLADSLALVRFIRERLNWQLVAIIWTGGKSIHAWFRTPPAGIIESLKTVAPNLGIDTGLIGHPEHPCRLPGQRHADTGELSRVLWLADPIP